MLEIGSVIDGKYKILNKIGQGGMSIVYLAINEAANKPWAIKEVRKDGTKDFEVVKQGLIVETDMLKRLNHPNLPSIIDVIDREDTFLIVMDYIEGRSLNDILKENGAQPQEYVIEWAKQLCDVLGYLHSRKPPIIYRDMKPSNVMLKPDGNVTLIDFGTAREFKDRDMVEDTICLGTQGYAAPEQFGGHGQTDPRTDIYSLGATLYHLVTGHNPAKPPYEMYPIRQWNPHLSSGLEQIISKCVQKNPNERYQSCSELMYALNHFEEMDYEYTRAQKLKFASFVATLGLSAVLFTTAGVMSSKETQYQNQNYDRYYQLATTAPTKNEFNSDIQNALSLDATDKNAYELILSRYKTDFSDGKENETMLTFGEYSEINNLINNGNDSKILRLREADAAGYYEFCYHFGLEIWSNIDNGSDYARTWLEKVEKYSADGHNNNKEYDTAQLLIRLSSYGNAGNSGGNVFDSDDTNYGEFWNDLESIYVTAAADSDNFSTPATQLYAYKKILGIITSGDNCEKFSGYIDFDTMRNMVDNIDNQLHNTSKYKADDSSYGHIYKSVEDQLEITRMKIDTVETSSDSD